MVWGTIIGLISIICAIWVIYDVWTVKKGTQTKRVLWTVAAVVFSIIAAIVYYFVEKK